MKEMIVYMTDEQWKRIEKATIRKINETNKVITIEEYLLSHMIIDDEQFFI